MATPEALVKYYNCLKDSFNKIQDKDNKTALVNAALRPGIREEFSKSKDVLTSYMNYVQVFSLIYSDKFTNICLSTICPLFKEYAVDCSPKDDDSKSSYDDRADQVHETIKAIIGSKPELAEEFVHCVNKLFPSLVAKDNQNFFTYLGNCLKICSYIRGDPLVSLMTKILEKINSPLTNIEPTEEVDLDHIKNSIDELFKLIYRRLEGLNKTQLENVTGAFLAAFTREFLSSENNEQLNYLILYLCSLDVKLTDLLVNLLWATFTNPGRPLSERQASVCFASSFMSRANYVDLDKVFNFLETASTWCNNLLEEVLENKDQETSSGLNETTQLFYSLAESMLYLITQRYRELYEDESIARLNKLNINAILASHMKPLEACSPETSERFCEVATLYRIADPSIMPQAILPARKRRKSGRESLGRPKWKMPYKETCESMPDLVKDLYRQYYNHRNFTIFRE